MDNGKVIYDYQESQNPDDIAEWMTRYCVEPYRTMGSLEEAEKWLDGGANQINMLLSVSEGVTTQDLVEGFQDLRKYKGGTTHDGKEIPHNVALQERLQTLYRLGICVSQDCVDKYGSSHDPMYGENPKEWGKSSITLHWMRYQMNTTLELGIDVFSQPLVTVFANPSLIWNWMETALPTAMQFKMEWYPRMARTGLPLFMLYVDVDWKTPAGIKKMNYYLNRLRQLSRKVEGSVLFTMADKSEFPDDLAQFGLDSSTPGELWTLRADDSKKFAGPTGHKFSVEESMGFIEEFRSGKKQQMFLSAEPPEEQTDRALIVTRNDLPDWLEDWSKGVMILFYAPWCPHSQKFLKEYEVISGELERYSHKVLLLKMDVTKNDPPSEYTITEYPTIYWHAPGSKIRSRATVYREAKSVLSVMDFFSNNNMSGVLPEFQWEYPALAPLTPDNFTQTLNADNRHVLVVFHTPYAGFHTSFPVVQQFSHLMRNRADVWVTEVDPDVHSELAKEHQIDTFPTMKLFKNGTEEGIRYNGAMVYIDMEMWLIQQIGTYVIGVKPPPAEPDAGEPDKSHMPGAEEMTKKANDVKIDAGKPQTFDFDTESANGGTWSGDFHSDGTTGKNMAGKKPNRRGPETRQQKPLDEQLPREDHIEL